MPMKMRRWLPWSGTAIVYALFSLVVWGAYVEHEAALARRAERQQLVDAVYFALAEGVRVVAAGETSLWCAGATYAALGPFGAFVAGALCGNLAYGVTDGASEVVHADLFGRPYHEDAANVGRIVGVIGGALLMAPAGDYGADHDYPTYAAEARGLTEQTYRANRALIDPAALRGAENHLHHTLPLRCGFALGIPAAIMASPSNLAMVTAEANLRIGDMGCGG